MYKEDFDISDEQGWTEGGNALFPNRWVDNIWERDAWIPGH